MVGRAGGLIVYLWDTLPFCYGRELDDQRLKTILITVIMQRLPREISNITIGLIHHPPGNKDRPLLDHIAGCIDPICQKNPDTGVLLCGDLINSKTPEWNMSCTWGSYRAEAHKGKAILDKTYTNFPIYYREPDMATPIGLSDHCVVGLPACPSSRLRTSHDLHGLGQVYGSQWEDHAAVGPQGCLMEGFLQGLLLPAAVHHLWGETQDLDWYIHASQADQHVFK